jgi:hypothetical protein
MVTEMLVGVDEAILESSSILPLFGIMLISEIRHPQLDYFLDFATRPSPRTIKGKKNRKSLSEVVRRNRFGQPFK